jgi:hypothetical protein
MKQETTNEKQDKMNKPTRPEAWLRGPLPDIPALLQPAAHALIQAQEDTVRYMAGFPETLLWNRPVERASVGFHLQHLTGVLDRMLTYAKDKTLSEEQFAFLRAEGQPNPSITVLQLLKAFEDKVKEALDYFKTLSPTELAQTRTVGRKKLPSTLIGLLFHAAEHNQRHVGQLLVTVSVVKAQHA